MRIGIIKPMEGSYLHALHTTNTKPLHSIDIRPGCSPPSTTRTPSAPHALDLPPLAASRREQGLPADLSRAVFANFNKIDKLDPESFFLWMQVLRRVPGSVLWLLEPHAVDTEVGLGRPQFVRHRSVKQRKGRAVCSISLCSLCGPRSTLGLTAFVVMYLEEVREEDIWLSFFDID